LPREAKPLVSCIIIFLNEEKYLAEAIESVIAQSYARWELLLVDDGSTDGSEQIARSYCKRFSKKMCYLTHAGRSNRGMSASRNLGLGSARGEFVAFLDGDDSWFPNKLERQVALFRQNPRAVMVCGATLYWHSWQPKADGNDRIVHVGQSINDGTAVRALDDDRLYEGRELLRRLYPLGKGVSPSMSGNMFRRDVLDSVKGFDDSFQGLFEDQVIRTKMYLNGPVYVSQHVFDRYRQHDESCFRVSKATGKSNDARRQFFLWLKQYLDNAGYRDPAVRLQLRRRMLRSQYPSVHRAWSRFQAALRQAVGRGGH
jgi:glycosyltransferase involved in cell wall biosynthesis